MTRTLKHRDGATVVEGDNVMTMGGDIVTVVDWSRDGQDIVTVHLIDGETKDCQAAVVNLFWKERP